jgi:hypothetical protein
MSRRLGPGGGAVFFQWIATVALVLVVLVNSALARQCLSGLWKDTGTNENPEVELTISGHPGQPQVVAKYTKVHRCRYPDSSGVRPLLPIDFDGYLISRIHIAGTLHMCKWQGGRTIGNYDATDLTLNLRDEQTLDGQATDLDGHTLNITLERLSKTPPTGGRCPEDSLPTLADQCEHATASQPNWEQLSGVCRRQGYAAGKPTDTTPGAGAPVRESTPEKPSPGEWLGDKTRDLIESERAKARGQ